MSGIQKGEIVEATRDVYGFAVRPNARGMHENFWVTAGTELQVTAVLRGGLLNVRYAAAGMDRAAFRFAEADIRRVRQVGVAPEGGLRPDHPALAWIWEDAARLADRLGFCEEFDRLADMLGAPGRERQFRIPMISEDGIRITASVTARSRALAEQRIRDRIAGSGPLELTGGQQ